jgi:hypothetical protein
MPRTVTGTDVAGRTRALVLPTTGLPLVDLALTAIASAMRPLLGHPKVDQTTIRDVAFTAGTAKSVEHMLGRKYQGVTLTNFRGSGATWLATVQSPSELDELQVTITASATCTADVEVW